METMMMTVDKFVRYYVDDSVDNYKEGMVLFENTQTHTVLVTYHCKDHEVQDVWLGEVEEVPTRKSITLWNPSWAKNNTLDLALGCYLSGSEEKSRVVV